MIEEAEHPGQDAANTYLLRQGVDHFIEAEAVLPLAHCLSDPLYLQAAARSWAGRIEAFLTALLRGCDYLAQFDSNTVDDIAGALFKMLVAQDPGMGDEIAIETVHALLSYRDPPTLYWKLLDHAANSEPSSCIGGRQGQIRLVGLWARRGNMLRRAGMLDEAKEQLATVERWYHDSKDKERTQTGSEMARVAYDLAYIAYLQGEFSIIQNNLERSISQSTASGDVCGAWISRCVKARMEMAGTLCVSERRRDSYETHQHLGPALTCAPDPRLFGAAIGALKAVLHEALGIFTKYWERDGNYNAERWIMNVHAHLFEAAFLSCDAVSAGKHLDILVRDPWITRMAPQGFIEPYLARRAMLAGRPDEALQRFKQMQDLGMMAPDREEVAREWFDLGWTCMQVGRPVDAREALKSGVACSPMAANKHWFGLLLHALGRSG